MNERATISEDELSRLSFCNSDRLLSESFAWGGIKRHWVGIGWVDEGPEDGSETLVIFDD